jgi:riboflavin synthase
MEPRVFTGIVQETGRLKSDPAPSREGGVRLVIAHSPAIGKRLERGASLAVSGVCLTVVEGTRKRSEVELSRETLSRTRLGRLQRGDELNLEAAMQLGDALGGHWVQGHVDGLATLRKRVDLEQHSTFTVEVPSGLERYLVEKGSVTLDGVSLTVAALEGDTFEVALVPHTLSVTTLGQARVGHRFHIEVDVLAKYVERMLAARAPAEPAVARAPRRRG